VAAKPASARRTKKTTTDARPAQHVRSPWNRSELDAWTLRCRIDRRSLKP
jgi:hypothetical protein